MSKNIVIGIDPDVKGIGVAVYENKKLTELHTLKLLELYHWLSKFDPDSVLMAVEDVTANSATFEKAYAKTTKAKLKISYCVGRNAQVGWHVFEICEELGLEVVKMKIAKHWKQGDLFKMRTGWTRRSNEETRSAAYMGYKAIKA